MGWAAHVACLGRGEIIKLLLEVVNGRDHSEDLGASRRILLKWIFWKQVGCG
jgi:hypothetical protein